MEQQQLRLLGRIDAPSVVPFERVAKCQTFRQAVRESWEIKRVTLMTHAQVAALAGVPRQHVSDYLNADDKRGRRNLPADKFKQWNAVMGNTLVSQWVAWQDQLTVLEQIQADQYAKAVAA